MILTRNCTTRSRCGFTLVELMVAAALSLTIMWILAESFKMGIDFARSARSTGDMMTQLNNTGQILTRDLQADHFIASPTVTNSNGKLTSQRYDLLGQSGTLANAQAITPNGPVQLPNGFFQLYSPPPPPLLIATDNEGFQINTVTATTLQFTVYLPSGYSQNLFTTTVGNNLYTSRAAEVAYFLGSPAGWGLPTGVTPPTPGFPSQNLYNLHRRQRLVAVTSDDVSNLTQAVLADMSATPPGLGSSEVISTTPGPTPTSTPTVNTLASFANSTTARVAPYVQGATYLAPAFSPLSSTWRPGDDILLSNVLSFEVLPTWSSNSYLNTATAPGTNLSARAFASNSNFPYDYLSLNSLNTAVPPNLFDTWFQVQGGNWNNLSTPTKFAVPMPIRVTGLQITIRIYDPKTKQARQNSWRIAM